MKWLLFVLVTILTAALFYSLDTSFKVSGNPTPAFGKLFSPFTGFWQQAEPVSASQTKQHLTIGGMNAPVEIIYDGRSVPHIFASSLSDAYRAQGYVAAKDRLWQMDISTRAPAGRLSEVLGERTLSYDLSMRRQGILRAAEQSVEAWKQSPESWKLINAYCEGVNAYINSLSPKDYPIEFKLIGYKPESWTPLHCALMIKGMALSLNRKEKDIAHSNALQAFGADLFAALYPKVAPFIDPIIPSSAAVSTPDSVSIDTIQALGWLHPKDRIYDPVQANYPKGIGSNNWAVSGKKTANGYPLLANDPHLKLTLPSIWYEVQLHTNDMNVYGASLPGLPGILIGFNEHIAWGETNVSHDVADWFAIEWTDAAQTHYLLDGEAKAVEEVIEQVHIRDQGWMDDTVRYTVWGPVVRDELSQDADNLVFHWVSSLQPNKSEILFIKELNAAKNYDDFQNSLRHYHSPAQNFVFASKDGDIAIRVQGRLPIRKDEKGWLVQEGKNTSTMLTDFIPHEELPHVINPDRGFVSSANQASTDTNYAYPYFGFFDEYRSRYLNRRLAKLDEATVDDMTALQLDNYSILPEEALPAMLKRIQKEEVSDVGLQMLEELEAWNNRFDTELAAPAIFEDWFQRIRRLSWDEIYDAPEAAPLPEPEDWVLIMLMNSLPDFPLFDDQDTEQTETAADIVTRAFIAMTDSLGSAFSEGTLQWGSYHKRGIPHLGRIPAFKWEDMILGGHPEALNSIRDEAAPSWRMIVELGPKVRAYGVYPGGQSGNPGSPYFTNMIENWANGEYYELKFMDDTSDPLVRSTQRLILH